MTPEQHARLAHFDAFYPAFMHAIDDEDVARVESLVAERDAVVVALITAFRDTPLPEAVRLHIEGSEALVHAHIVAFLERITVRLVDSNRHAAACARYEEAA